MTSNWDTFKSLSVEEQINNNPWESRSSGNYQTSTAPKPAAGSSNNIIDNDVASIISGLSAANSNLFGKANSVFAGANLSYSYPNGTQAAPNSTSAASVTGGANQPTNASPVPNNFEEAIVSDSGSDLLNPNLRDALSAISAPTGQHKSRFASNLFASASVAGINVTGFNSSSLGSSNFLEKFASVTEKTRELELNMGKMSINSSNGIIPNRSAPNVDSTAAGSDHLGSRRSSMVGNEMNTPSTVFREPRKQSFSEKLDTYIISSTSPNNSRHLSFSSDANLARSEHNSVIMENTNDQANSSIWNPATAPTFHPSGFDMQQQQFQMQQFQQLQMQPGSEYAFMQQQAAAAMMSPFGIAPGSFFAMPQMLPQFMQPGAPIPPMDGSTFDSNNGEASQSDESKPAAESDEADGDATNSTSPSAAAAANLNAQQAFFQPGLMQRSMSPFMIPPFNPYGMFAPPNMPGQAPSQPLAHQTQGQRQPQGSNNMSGSPMLSGAPPSMVNSPLMATTSNSPLRVQSPGDMPPNSKNMKKSMSPKPSKQKKYIVRSPLLEEFRNNKNKDYTLRDIYGHGYEFAKDQHGSRFIQQQLAVSNDQDKEAIFNEIRSFSIDLITDVFGNYVIQKYFEYGNKVQRKILFESMKGSFNQLSLQMYGCRVVQKCLEVLELPDQLLLLDEVKANILAMVKDQNGNHVIQKSIECMPIAEIPFILDSLKDQIYHLSTHPYGCRVIQRLLEFSSIADQKFILNELKGYIYYLIQDQFGNYVIQHIIEHGSTEYTNEVLNTVLTNLVELSKHKFASNAVEKCIIYQSVENRVKIYNAILKDNMELNAELDEESALSLMMKDPFANYVVQKMVELIEPEKKKLLIMKIREYLDLINKGSYGKHLASIEKLIALSESFPVM